MRTYCRITPVGLLILLLGLGLLGPATTQALDLTAGNAADLNTAILGVNGAAGPGPHTITLTADIALTASPPEIGNVPGVKIVIDGAGFTLDGQGMPGVRPVSISAAIVEIRDTKIIGGNILNGGGVLNAGLLTMTNCTVSGNDADVGSGGGIRNDGLLLMTKLYRQRESRRLPWRRHPQQRLSHDDQLHRQREYQYR